MLEHIKKRGPHKIFYPNFHYQEPKCKQKFYHNATSLILTKLENLVGITHSFCKFFYLYLHTTLEVNCVKWFLQMNPDMFSLGRKEI